MMYEWSGRTVTVDKKNGFEKNQEIFLVNNPNEININAKKYKILRIEYDINAPDTRFEGCKLIIRKSGFYNRFTKPFKVPYHWVGKTKEEAIKLYFKYDKQIKDLEKYIKKGI